MSGPRRVQNAIFTPFSVTASNPVHPYCAATRALALGGSLFERRPVADPASILDLDGMAITGVSRAHRLAAKSAIVERALLWAFIAGLAWCPFWFGSHVLLAWGINAVVFP